MEEDNTEFQEFRKHFPTGLSKDIKNYIENAFDHFIFTRRVGKQQYGYCTHCHKEFKTKGLLHNSTAECPYCKSKCIVKASGYSHKYLINEGYFVYYEKSLIDPQAIIARGIYAVQDFSSDYHNIKTDYMTTALYLLNMSKCTMFRRDAYYSMANTIEFFSWYKCKSIYSLFNLFDEYSKYRHISIDCSYESIKKSVKNTPFQYSTWEKYSCTWNKHSTTDMVKFFNLYSKYPAIEYLTKLGFTSLVYDKLANYRTFSAINWRGKTLLKVLGLTKNELKEIKVKNIDVTFVFLKLLQISKKDKSNYTLEEIKSIEQANNYYYYYKELQSVLKYMSLRRANNYINKQYDKQRKLNPSSKYNVFYDKGQVLISLNDYISDCIKLNADVTDEHVLFPKNLYMAHQNTSKVLKVNENKELDKYIRERLKYLDKYNFEYNGLLIRAAKSSKELIEEGQELHHCVATYIEKYAKAKTNILVIRKISDPEIPYFTLELRDNLIIQCYGNYDCPAGDDVKKFIGAFKNVKLGKKLKNRIEISA